MKCTEILLLCIVLSIGYFGYGQSVSNPGQMKLDGTTAISDGGWTNESGVTFRAYIDPGAYPEARLEVEVVQSGALFSNVPTVASALVSSASTVLATQTQFSDGTGYIWQYRLVSGTGAVLVGWTAFSTNDPNFSVDLSAPGVPSPSSPTDGEFLNTTNPTISWSTSADIGSGLWGYFMQLFNGADPNNPVDTYSGPNTSYTTTATLSDGIYFWSVRAIDNVGNQSDWSEIWTFTVDLTQPSVDIDNPADGSSYEQIESVIIDGGAWDNAPATPAATSGLNYMGILIQSANGNYWNSGLSSWQAGAVWNDIDDVSPVIPLPSTLPPTTEVSWTYSLSDVLPDGYGIYTATILVQDKAGNQYQESVSFYIVGPNEEKEGIASCGGSILLCNQYRICYVVLLIVLLSFGILVFRRLRF